MTRTLGLPARLMITAGIAAAGAAVGFAVFAGALFEQNLADLDAAGRKWTAVLRSPVADAFFRAVTWLATTRVVLPTAFLAAVIIWRLGARRVAVPVVVAPVLAPILTRPLKSLFGRLRPGYVDAAGRSFSFPSGHTTLATAVALTLAYVMAREGIAPRLAPIAAGLFVLAVGASRVYLGEHWITDVVGGWAVGVAIAATCATIYELVRLRENRAPEHHDAD